MGSPPYEELDHEPVDHGLAAFDDFLPPEPADPPDTGEELFSVTNPPGTVTVSALSDGRVHRIELSPEAVTVPEDGLSAEILVIAELATMRARAAQFSYMLEGMQGPGHDSVETRDFLHRTRGLPAPEEADAAQARLFATRYASEHD